MPKEEQTKPDCAQIINFLNNDKIHFQKIETDEKDIYIFTINKK
jgi:hypothetical protein